MGNRTGTLGKQILAHARNQVLKDLLPLGAYLYYSAASGSQYVKFADPRLGSLRIGDHKGIGKYRYKWNLTAGGKRRTANNNGRERHYFPIEQIDELCIKIREYRRELLEKYGEYDIRRDPFAGKRKRMTER